MLYLFAAASAVIGFLCKPVPLLYFAPLFLLLWLSLPASHRPRALAAAAVGALLTTAIFLGPLIILGASPGDIGYYTLFLQGRIGASRLGFNPLFIFAAYSFELASLLIAIAAFATCLLLLASHPFTSIRLRELLPLIVGGWMVLTIVSFQHRTQLHSWQNIGPVFVCLGAAQAALLSQLRLADHRETAVVTSQVIGALFAIVALIDSARFTVTANAVRGYLSAPRITEEVRDVLSEEPGFTDMRFFAVEGPTYRSTTEEVKNSANTWRDLIHRMRSSPDNPLLVGFSAFFYAIADKPSPLPIVAIRPGYTSPGIGTSEYQELRGKVGRNLRKYAISYAIISAAKADDPSIKQAMAAVACDVERMPSFSTMRFCSVSSPETLDFIMLASGLASRPEF